MSCQSITFTVMSKDALDAVVAAKEKGWRVIGEAIAAGLTLDDTKMYDPDWSIASRYVMSPPLRSPEHKFHIQNAIKTGLLDLVWREILFFQPKTMSLTLNFK